MGFKKSKKGGFEEWKRNMYPEKKAFNESAEKTAEMFGQKLSKPSSSSHASESGKRFKRSLLLALIGFVIGIGLVVVDADPRALLLVVIFWGFAVLYLLGSITAKIFGD